MSEYDDEQFAVLDALAHILSAYLMQSCIVGFVAGVLAGVGVAIAVNGMR